MVVGLDAIKANAKYKHPGMPARSPVFIHGDTIKGKLSITPKSPPFEHTGVRVSINGIYQNSEGLTQERFFTKTLDLLPPGVLSRPLKSPFTFTRVAVPYPTYLGKELRIVYYVECDAGGILARRRFYILRPTEIVERPLTKSIGIENLIHLDVAIRSTVIDARRCFIGALYMTLSRVRMIHMNLELHRVEKLWTDGACDYTGEDETLMDFEIMDGAPVRGTMIPIRMFVGECKCWPSPKEPGCRITCDYYLKIRGLDEAENSYIKRIPIEFSIDKNDF